MTKTGRRQFDRLLLTAKEYGHEFLADKDIIVPSLTALSSKDHKRTSDFDDNSFKDYLAKALDLRAPPINVDGAPDGASGRLNQRDGSVEEHESLRYLILKVLS